MKYVQSLTLNIFHTLLRCYYCCFEQLNVSRAKSASATKHSFGTSTSHEDTKIFQNLCFRSDKDLFMPDRQLTFYPALILFNSAVMKSVI